MASIREKFKNLSPVTRAILFFIGGLLVLLIILQILISLFADDYAANKLRNQLKQTDSTQRIDFDELKLNLFSGSATISGISITADTAALSDSSKVSGPPIFFTGSVDKLDISGSANIFSTLLGDELSIGSITISRPHITAIKNPGAAQPDSSRGFVSVDSTIYAALPSQYSAIEVDELSIQDGQAELLTSGDTTSSLHSLDLRLQNIRVDSASAKSGRLFPTHELSLQAQDFRMKLADSLNIIAFQNLSISSEDQNFRLDSLELIPRYGKLQFAWRHGTRIDRVDLTIPEIKAEQIDFSQLSESGKFYAGYLEINKADLKDYMNRGAPGGTPGTKTLPFVKFKNMKQPIKIDSLKINDSFISYSEYHSTAPRAGTVTFEKLDATFRNISNYPEEKENGITTTLDASSQVMGRGLLKVHFEFPMDTKNAFHKIKGKLASMPMTDFNSMSRYVAKVYINKGMLNSLEFEMTLNRDKSNGTAIMNYENLKFSVVNLQTQKQEGLKENIVTFLGNNFLVKKNNTPEAGMQAGKISFERDKSKSIFNYWWKSLLTGIKSSAKR